jgi:hypothetical protein
LFEHNLLPNDTLLSTRAEQPETAGLLTNAQQADDVEVSLRIMATNIIEQASSTANQTQQSTSRSKVASVSSHVFGQAVDSLGQDRNLYLWRASVGVIVSVFRNYGGFTFFRNRHQVLASGLIVEFSPQVYRSPRSLQRQNGSLPGVADSSAKIDGC